MSAGAVLTNATGQERVTAQRALGVAHRTLGNVSESIEALEEALETAIQLSDPQTVGQVETSLAPSVAYTGDMARAFDLLERAESKLEGLDKARAQAQRAGLVARTGDFSTSLTLFAQAEPDLIAADDTLWLANLSANRGLVHVYSGSYAEAERDLGRAEDLYARRGDESASAEMTHNLGFLAAQRGDFAEALTLYRRARSDFVRLGHPIDELDLDRSAALLTVGLADDAFAATEQVLQELADSDNEVARGEALVAHAQAALEAGDYATAVEAAGSATGLLSEHGRPGWQARAEYLALLAAAEAGQEPPPESFVSVVSELQRNGQTFQALHAQLMAGRAALKRSDVEGASRLLSSAATPQRHSPVDLRIQAALANALLRDALGDSRGALAALRSGVNLLDDFRSTLGSTETRANVVRHADELFDLGLEMAFRSNKPSRVLSWVGRTRAGALRHVSPSASSDEEFDNALASLRMLQIDRREAELEGGLDPVLLKAQAAQEQEVRRLSLRRPGGGTSHGAPIALRTLQESLDGKTMIVFVERGAEMVALRVRPSSITMKTVGGLDEIRRESAHLGRAVRALASRPEARTTASTLEGLRHSAEHLDRLLFQPLNLRNEELVVVPTPGMHALPWAALPTLAVRPFVTVPSPYFWHEQQRATPPLSRAALVAGPDLEHAEFEIDQLHRQDAGAEILKGSDASVVAVSRAMESSDLVHLVCHGNFRSDNAMFSSLRLADGDLTVYELERLGRTPTTVVLSACDTGLSDNAAGEELMGLSTVLASLGTTSLVVSVAPIPDAGPTIALMTRFHEEVSNGRSPADALATARQTLSSQDPKAVVAASSFFVMGAR